MTSSTLTSEYQQRVLQEDFDLGIKIKALSSLLEKEQPSFISDTQWSLLNYQLVHMEKYADALQQRIADFQQSPTPCQVVAETSDSIDARMEADINQLGLNAPRVPKEHIDNLMQYVQYKTHIVEGTTTTVAVAVLPMGTVDFTLAIESTACVDNSNFNADLGAKYAIEKAATSARDKLWELEGYVLALCVHNNDVAMQQAIQESFDPNDTINS